MGFATMRKNPFHPGPLGDLSPEALSALRRIREGKSVASRQCVELEIEDLIEEGLAGWVLTDVGSYRLDRGH